MSSEVETPLSHARLNGLSTALEANGIGQREENGAPGAIRTPGPQIRSLMLYPAELRVHGDALLGVCPGIRNPYFAFKAACAAANLAIGTRYGEAET